MSRKIKIKELKNTRLASNYSGWLYCEGCDQTIGYLCYATYDLLLFEYTCKCGNCGSIRLSFDEDRETKASPDQMVLQKNRLCCPADQSPLLTIRDKNLSVYHCTITCIACSNTFAKEFSL